MPNGTYGGVRGRKTKVGRELLRFPPTRFDYLAVRTGLEPATPCVTGMYSNQLNYRTISLFCCYLSLDCGCKGRHFFYTCNSNRGFFLEAFGDLFF